VTGLPQQNRLEWTGDFYMNSRLLNFKCQARTDTNAIAKTIESLGVFRAQLITADPVAGSKEPRAR
jgi:hypothetical protein